MPHPSRPRLPDLSYDLGDLLPVFRTAPELALTGGYLARLACGLPVGGDIDVLCSLNGYIKLREALYARGYYKAGETSTGFRDAAGDADTGVAFREKWEHDERIGVDCLVLLESTHYQYDVNFIDAAYRFIRTYDCGVAQQLLYWGDSGVTSHRTWAAQDAIDARVPGWIDGAITHPGRRERWDRLLPGRS